MLEVRDLSVDFTTSGGRLQAVRGVSFDVSEGEIVGVVGESGSGKSVTAHALLRLLPANGAVTSGTIAYRGTDIAAMDSDTLRAYRGKEVAMIFQEPGRSFDPIYSIGKSLVETLRAHNPDISDEEARARSIRLLEEVHVDNAASRLENFPHQFSGGLLQRVMIAHALASDPALLIADEPTTALDVTIQAGIVELLLELRRSRNLAILFITHNLALLSSFADRIVVMYGGLMMETGPTESVLSGPHHPYTAGLLASLVSFGSHYSEGALQVLGGAPPDPIRREPGCPFAPRCPLRRDECTSRVPPVVHEERGVHRCVVPGVKDASLFSREEGA